MHLRALVPRQRTPQLLSLLKTSSALDRLTRWARVGPMLDFLRLFVHVLAAPFRTQAQLEAEITMLRHQLNVLRRQTSTRPRLTTADRLLFVWLCRLFPSLQSAITIVQPDTVLRWHRSGFRLYWRWKSRSHGGRPKIPIEIRSLIRRMSEEKPGARRATMANC